MSERYVVSSVTGYWIFPQAGQRNGSKHRTVSISYYVLDRDYGYEIVGDFTALPWGGKTNLWRRRSAEELCARLNADEELAA